MPISITCTGCQSVLKVRDELLGKRIKCPKCGASFTASQAAATVRNKESNQKAGHGIHLSPGVIMFLCALIFIPGTLLFWKLGPGKVRQQWAELEPKAEENVKDVVDRGLQAYLSQHGRFDPSKPHLTPQAHDVVFIISPMPFSMPEKVGFAGITTEGAMTGRYFPATGQIEADVEIGGQGFPGAVNRHGDKTISVAGQIKDGNVTATVDGAPAEIKWPAKRDDEK
jgi:hypothetical protein